MIIRILLLALLAVIGWRFFIRRNRLPVHIIVVALVLGLAALAVVFPESTNDIAHAVGVGRGADLITYLVEVGLLFVTVHYYTKFVEVDTHITKLVRELAIVRSELADLKQREAK
jgi:hypothetical protein